MNHARRRVYLAEAATRADRRTATERHRDEGGETQVRQREQHRERRSAREQRSEADELLQEVTPAERMASWHIVAADGATRSGGAAIPVALALLPGGQIDSLLQ